MAHLFLAITAHGYGHLAQSAPIVTALAQRLPGLRVKLQGDLDPLFAGRRLPRGFRHIRDSADVGLLMDGPLRTLWEESLNACTRFEAEYGERLRRQTRIFRQDPPNLVLADVPWLPLDAAKVMGIPAEAACNGKPVLYVSRGDWPEEPALTG